MNKEKVIKSLEELGIYQLRTVAREVGVHNPTVLKRQELIEKIVKVASGEESRALVKKSNAGRPSKVTGAESLASVIFGANDSNEDMANKKYEFMDISKMFSNTLHENNNYQTYDASGTNKNQFNFNGYLISLNDTCGIISKNKYFAENDCVYISILNLKKYGLKLGDYVEGKYVVLSDGNLYNAVISITSINNNLFTENSLFRTDFEEIESIYPKTKIVLTANRYSLKEIRFIDKTFPMGKGSRILMRLGFYDTENRLLQNILNAFSNNNIKTTCVLIGERPEDIGEFKRSQVTCDYLMENNQKTIKQTVQELETTILNSYRLVENGQDIAIVIKDANKLFEFVKSYYVLEENCSLEVAEIKTINMIKKMFSSAKNTERHGTLTVLMGYNNESALVSQLIPISTSYLHFGDKHFESTCLYLDLSISKTLKYERLLTSKELKDYDEFVDGLDYKNINAKLEKILA